LHPVDALLADAAHEPFRILVRQRAPGWDRDLVDAARDEPGIEGGGELESRPRIRGTPPR
jgi:hypothetical protein